MDSVKIGLAGAGTVGGGVCRVLNRNQEQISARAGARIEVKYVTCRHPENRSDLVPLVGSLGIDWHEIVEDPEIAIAVEAMGGIEPARSFILAAIDPGNHVVTANKALLAQHGDEIFDAAAKKGVIVAFEASVAGGIPIIKAMRESLVANRIQSVVGIINGTSNFILTSMRKEKISFAEALSKAQKLGYAEADPSFDIDGIDAAHKISILSSIAFGGPISFDKAYIEGIRDLQNVDIEFADQLGYRVKLLGITKRRGTGIELRVHPTLVPERRLLAHVGGVTNAVEVKGDAVGSTLYYGPGAGSEPTASAMIADIVDVVRMIGVSSNHQVPVLGYKRKIENVDVLPMGETVCSYYLRIGVTDSPGTLADVSRVFADMGISIESLIQKEAVAGQGSTSIVLMTHTAWEAAVQEAIRRIEALDCVTGKIVLLRKEELN